jgi:hypothetical protein
VWGTQPLLKIPFRYDVDAKYNNVLLYWSTFGPQFQGWLGKKWPEHIIKRLYGPVREVSLEPTKNTQQKNIFKRRDDSKLVPKPKKRKII